MSYPNVLTSEPLRPLVDLALAGGSNWAADGSLPLPLALGRGVLHRLELEPGLIVTVLRGVLSQPLALPHLADPAAPAAWLLVCQMPRPQAGPALPASVQLVSSALAATTLLPAQLVQAVVGVSVTGSLLARWLTPADGPLAAVLTALQPVALDVNLSPGLQLAIGDLIEQQADAYHSIFSHNVKVRELLYQLLRELAPRLAAPRHLHAADVEKVLRVRDLMLTSLNTTPQLRQLATEVGLRVPTLQTLFRELFGSSPYQYFQVARMQEARRRLHFSSVSEVGFALGFSNLSHFARLFEKHYLLTPKKYQTAHGVAPCQVGSEQPAGPGQSRAA